MSSNSKTTLSIGLIVTNIIGSRWPQNIRYVVVVTCCTHSSHSQRLSWTFSSLLKDNATWRNLCCQFQVKGNSCSSHWTHSSWLQLSWNCLYEQLWKMNVPIRCKNLLCLYTPVARKELWKDSDFSGSSLEHTHSQQRARKLCVELLTQMLQ
jgi:hypothetical protein